MRIGLTLSGGGFRATVFHLGVLARLAEDNWLEQVALLSTVSGGSLCAALVYSGNDFVFPTSRQFVEQVVPRARDLITSYDLQLGLLGQALRAPLSIFDPHANTLSALLKERWGVTARLRSIPESPRWLINATCYETSKNWRFESFRMGDYTFGYTYDTDIALSDAVAASSGFPGLIGPLVLDTTRFRWFKYRDETAATQQTADGDKTEPTTPDFPIVHLWDGGVYDNFGMEGVFNFDAGWRHDLDYVIVSDAAGRPQPEPYSPGARSVLRLVNIMMDQVRSLRTRAIVERMQSAECPGAFLQIGNCCEDVLRDPKFKGEVAQLSALCMKSEETEWAARLGSTIRKLKPDEFDRLFRHGYEVANYTLYAYAPPPTKFMSYGQSRWAQPPSTTTQPAANPAT